MTKKISPIIGLAVVMALAVAAVFGSMSLANPALAAIGQPADAELTERTFSPQSAPTIVARGAASSVTLTYDNVRDPGSNATPKPWFDVTDWQYRYRANIANEAYGPWTTTASGNTTVTTGGTPETSMVTTTISALTNGQEYQFQVRLLDGDGTGSETAAGPVSNAALATPIAAPDGDAPVLEAEQSALGGAVDLTWTYTDGDDVPATGWQYASAATGATPAPADWMDIPGKGNLRMHTVTELEEADVQHFVRPVNMTSPGSASAAIADVAPRGASVVNLQATAGDGNVRLTWNPVTSNNTILVGGTATAVTHYSYDYYPTDDADSIIVSGREAVGASRGLAMVDGLDNDTEYTFNVYLHHVSDATPPVVTNSGASRVVATPMAVVIPIVPQAEGFSAASNDPGDNTRYTFEFNADMPYTPGIDDIELEFNEDFSVPSSIAESSVNIQVGTGGNVTHPVSVLVDGETITLELGDLTDEDDNDLGMIPTNTPVTVVFRPSAGISNPTEGGKYDEIKAQGVDLASDTSDMADGADNRFEVIIKISLDEDEGGRGDTITVTGKGFKNGTTVTFMRMASEKDRMFANADPLCAANADGNDIAKCEFTVTSPLFQPGDNYINGVDGRSNPGTKSKAFKLEASISANPASGAPGDSIQIQLNDFNQGSVTGVLIARRYICEMDGEANMLARQCPTGYSKWTPNEAIPMNGELTFRVVIPNDAPRGVQDLRVESTGGNDGTNITIAGPRVTSNPATVIANQRLSLTGSGFTSNSRISRITFAGHEIEDWPANTGPSVDNGGNWSLSVDLPITASTTSAGDHRILVEDEDGRTGSVMVTVPERMVTITPDTGRVGTIAVVRGENFPSKNDEGSTFSLSIIYEAQNGRTTTSSIPDASGRFETQIRIPTTATIPSTNLITVSLDGAMGTMAPVQVNHNVPEGIIELSATSGGPGSVITISGEGFKSFVPVTSVTVGALEVTPSPKPSTDVNGMLNFDVVIPGLDTGIQTIEVKVSGTTAGTGFTVTESGVNPGDIKPVAVALEAVGDNLDSIWHFNNDTKAWNFYDGLEGSDLTHLITGETYLLQIKSTTEVILNGKTRNLTCNAAGNCWNQIVW